MCRAQKGARCASSPSSGSYGTWVLVFPWSFEHHDSQTQLCLMLFFSLFYFFVVLFCFLFFGGFFIFVLWVFCLNIKGMQILKAYLLVF